jgi:hypothetical protein
LSGRHGATSSLLRVWAIVGTNAYAVCEASFVPLELEKMRAENHPTTVGMDGLQRPAQQIQKARTLDGGRTNGILPIAPQGHRS